VQLPLRRLRLRLTAWYVGSFAAILLVVGFGMYWVTAQEVEAQLGRSLSAATAEVVRASRVAEDEGVPSGEAARGAVEVIEVPGSNLYLFIVADSFERSTSKSSFINTIDKAFDMCGNGKVRSDALWAHPSGTAPET